MSGPAWVRSATAAMENWHDPQNCVPACSFTFNPGVPVTTVGWSVMCRGFSLHFFLGADHNAEQIGIRRLPKSKDETMCP